MSLLLQRLFDNKDNIFVLVPASKEKSPFVSEMRVIGITNILRMKYWSLGINFLRSCVVILCNLYATAKLYFYVRKKHIDVIYSNTSITVLGIVVAILTGREHIWHIHEPIEHAHGWVNSLQIFYRIFFQYKKNKFVFATKTQQNQWLEIYPEIKDRAIVVYNPIKKITIQPNLKCDHSNVCFGYMGGRDKRKNLPLLIETFAKLHERHPNVRLLLAKNVGLENELIKLKIEQFNLQKIVFEENFDNPDLFYNQIDVFVLPSFSETWGLVVLEAASVQKPSVLTCHTGLNELFSNNIECCFIDPFDASSLYAAMEKMLVASFRLEVGQNAYCKIESYRFDKQFYESFCKLLALENR